MKIKRGHILRFTGFFFVILFIEFYACKSFFYHSHIVGDCIVSHSHPYNDKPLHNSKFPIHSHSNSAFQILQQINEISLDELIMITTVSDPFAYECNIDYWDYLFFDYLIFNQFTRLRAPPSIS